MNRLLFLAYFLLSLTLSACGAADESSDEPMVSEEFEMTIDYYRGICERHPYNDFCLRVDMNDGQGFITTPTCYTGAELSLGVRYKVKASLQAVDNGDMYHAACWDQFVISEVLESEEINEPFVLNPAVIDFYDLTNRPLNLLGTELTFEGELEDLYRLTRQVSATSVTIEAEYREDKIHILNYKRIDFYSYPDEPCGQTEELLRGGLSCGCGAELQCNDEGTYYCEDDVSFYFQQTCN